MFQPEVRRIVLGILVLSLLAAEPSASYANRRHRALCVVYRCHTLAATARMRVFQATNRHPAREETFLSGFVRWLPTGRVTALGDNIETTRGVFLRRLALAGRFVASATVGEGKETAYEQQTGWSIERINAKTKRSELARVSSASSEASNPNQKCNGFVPNGAPGVTDIVVTSTGTVGWIVGGGFDQRNHLRNLSSRTICELPPGSTVPVAVASDPSIRPKSLAAIPGHLYWIEGSTARSAVIP